MDGDCLERYEASYYLKSASLELTSKCNLRCTYCSVSQPGYLGLTMSSENEDAALAGLRAMKVNDVALNGHGETTMLKDWSRVAKAMRETGARVHLTSNFSRPFSKEELRELAALTSVIVSLDTDDPDLLKRVRRNVSLDVILDNIRGLKDAARRRGLRGPVIIASCVVHAQNVMHLNRFVRFALHNGIKGFSFCNLIKNADLPGALNVDHVTTLPPDQLAAAHGMIIEARGIAISKGASCEVQSGLLDSIEQKLKVSNLAVETTIQNKRRHFTAPRAGETRRCFDPWFFALIQADASVRPCCWHPAVGSLAHESLDAIMNGGSVISLRRQLMGGELNEYCATCPAKPVIPVTDFRELVQREVARSPLIGKVRRGGIAVKQFIRRHKAIA